MSLINLFMILFVYIVTCALIWFKWDDHKQQNNYTGLYIGDILIGIIALPLTIIIGFVIMISKIMNVKIWDKQYNKNLNNQDSNVKNVPPTNTLAPKRPPKQK